MNEEKILAKYTPTIGIECHVQLKTKTKLFSDADNDAREAEPNSLVTPLCFGLPGTLPVLNEAVIDVAIKAGKALRAKVALESHFDRKHYFYPDLPKGYQITQLANPIIGEGEVEVPLSNGEKIKVGIERAHLEEDAGKSSHTKGGFSEVDLNRAGTPLLEIVSKPDIHSAEAAKAYAQELYFLMKYADVSEADLYHGNMRFDVNISLATKDSLELGTRAEIKNLNSFRSVEKAVTYEIKRQAELLEKGQSVVQETRGWDDAKMKTFSQRSKEDAHDYRYFPDPDLPPVRIEQDYIDELQAKTDIIPLYIRDKLARYDLDVEQTNTILNNPDYIDPIVEAVETNKELAKRVINWLLVDVQGFKSKDDENISAPTIKSLKELNQLVDAGDINSSAAKDVLYELCKDSSLSAKKIAEEKDLIQQSDETELLELVKEIIKENPQAVEDLKSGEMKVMGFMVGQAMKKTGGSANPQVVTKLIKQELNL